MIILYYIASDFTCEIIINQRNSWFSKVVITILDFAYIRYYKIVANMAHTELFIAYQPL